jgi:hypothetical protein
MPCLEGFIRPMEEQAVSMKGMMTFVKKVRIFFFIVNKVGQKNAKKDRFI